MGRWRDHQGDPLSANRIERDHRMVYLSRSSRIAWQITVEHFPAGKPMIVVSQAKGIHGKGAEFLKLRARQGGAGR